MSKKIIILVDAIISIALIAAIFYYIGVDRIIAQFGQIDYFYLLLSMVFLLLMDVVVAFRIKILLEAANVKARLKETFISNMVGMLFSDFTPGRSGYFATAATLTYNYKVPSDKAMMSILGPQAIDFMIKVIVGTVSMLYLTWYVLQITDAWFIFAGALLMVLMIAIMLLLLFSARFLKLFSFACRFPILKRIYLMLERMQKSSHIVVKKLPEIIGITLVSWTAKAVSWFFVAKSLGITIGMPAGMPELVFYYFLQPTLTILEFIPSPTIAGIGLSEGGGAVLLSLFGVSAAAAASFVFLARIKTVFVNLIAVPETLRTAKGLKNDIF